MDSARDSLGLSFFAIGLVEMTLLSMLLLVVSGSGRVIIVMVMMWRKRQMAA
jgi:hypothetical protein